MPSGAITGYIDVAQLVLYVFWIFFACLIYYLLRENKREGYPLESDRSGSIKVQGWPPIPSPKTYKLPHGGTVKVPNFKVSPQTLKAVPTGPWPGAPLVPTGNPMLDGVGPGAYADRADVPDRMFDGEIKIVPLRVAPDYDVATKDADPRGMPVMGADGLVGGTVTDLWVDRSEALFRYFEVEVPVAGGVRSVLLPINFTRVENPQGLLQFAMGSYKGGKGIGKIKVKSILAAHFADVPGTAKPDEVTFLEEEKIMAYYGAGTLYATPSRQEPLI
jgi:photosynthetic reaction center H subunit